MTLVQRRLEGISSQQTRISAPERLAALIDEHVCALDPVSLLLALQELEDIQLIPLRVMDAIGAALEPAGDDVRFGRSMSSQRRSQASETRRPCR
jgi:hypothetical protein